MIEVSLFIPSILPSFRRSIPSLFHSRHTEQRRFDSLFPDSQRVFPVPGFSSSSSSSSSSAAAAVPPLALRRRPLQLVPLLDVLLAELLDLVPVLLAGAAREHEPAHDGRAENPICNNIF